MLSLPQRLAPLILDQDAGAEVVRHPYRVEQALDRRLFPVDPNESLAELSGRRGHRGNLLARLYPARGRLTGFETISNRVSRAFMPTTDRISSNGEVSRFHKGSTL